MIRVGVVPANKVLFAGTIPANNLFLFFNLFYKRQQKIKTWWRDNLRKSYLKINQILGSLCINICFVINLRILICAWKTTSQCVHISMNLRKKHDEGTISEYVCFEIYKVWPLKYAHLFHCSFKNNILNLKWLSLMFSLILINSIKNVMRGQSNKMDSVIFTKFVDFKHDYLFYN